MKNQRAIIRSVRSMRAHELLDLIVYNPLFFTDACYVEIGKAVRSRYAALKSDFQVYYFISKKLRSTGPPGLGSLAAWSAAGVAPMPLSG